MILPMRAFFLGFVLLLWSAGRFVDGAAAAARLGLPALDVVNGYGCHGRQGRIIRIGASLLLLGLVAYTGWLVNAVLTA